MPTLRIETNVKSDDITSIDDFLAELSEAATNTLGKPQEYISITVVPSVAMMMGKDPQVRTAQAVLTCMGKLGVEENKKHSSVLYPIIKKHLGVEGNMCYIIFNNVQAGDVGFKGTTFHEILKK